MLAYFMGRCAVSWKGAKRPSWPRDGRETISNRVKRAEPCASEPSRGDGGGRFLPDFNRFFSDFNIQNLQPDKAILNVTQSIGKSLLNQGGIVFWITGLPVLFWGIAMAFE